MFISRRPPGGPRPGPVADDLGHRLPPPAVMPSSRQDGNLLGMERKLRYSWVVPGRLAVGEHPRSLATLAGLGFQAALSLQEEEEDGPRDDSPPDFSFVRVPVRDGLVGGAPTPAQLKEASDAIGRFLDAGLPTYVFCYAGVGRSPLACMAYLGRTGRLSLGEAYRKVAGAH